jgi:hypothetical protein
MDHRDSPLVECIRLPQLACGCGVVQSPSLHHFRPGRLPAGSVSKTGNSVIKSDWSRKVIVEDLSITYIFGTRLTTIMLATRLSSRRGLSLFMSALICTTFVFLEPFWSPLIGSSQHVLLSKAILPRDEAANSTLGLQKILVLSTGSSWRTRGLKAAASYTGLDVEIPDHPLITAEFVQAFSNIGDEETVAAFPAPGSALAWLSHLDLLKYIVQSGLETALIFEDDVDWDVAVKDQIRLMSDAVRNFTKVASSDPSPYCRNWDILWIGHCGDVTTNATERVEYSDPTVLAHADYTGWSRRYNHGTWSEGHRLVQHGANPICTSAFAVTRHGAQHVLEWAGSGQDEAFDVRLAKACRSESLKVLTIQPELMHHYQPPQDAGYWSEVNAGDGKGTASDESAFESKIGTTENVPNSARCKALFDSTCVKPFHQES